MRMCCSHPAPLPRARMLVSEHEKKALMLEAENITVNYGPRAAVANVSLNAEPGELIAIIGPNGAGKSTLLGVLNGSIKATRGSVLLNGTPLSAFARRAVARQIA